MLHILNVVPSYPKSSSRKDYGRREDLPPRSRVAVDYSPRVAPPERRPSYRDEYPSRGSGYTDLSRSAARPSSRRAYVDDGYGQRFERPPPSYREGRPRDYDSISGSKRPYGALVSELSHLQHVPILFAVLSLVKS